MTVQTFHRRAEFGYKAGSRTGKIHRINDVEAHRVSSDGSLRFSGSFECGRRCDDVALVADWTLFDRTTCDACGVASPDQFVYFAERHDVVKIGWTRNLDRRMKELDATLLAALHGGRYMEDHLHQLFVADRVVGEWHRFSDQILRFLLVALRDEKVVAGSLLREAAA